MNRPFHARDPMKIAAALILVGAVVPAACSKFAGDSSESDASDGGSPKTRDAAAEDGSVRGPATEGGLPAPLARDGGAQQDGGTPRADAGPPPPVKLVFVTSAQFGVGPTSAGNTLSGVDDGDNKCNMLANKAGLAGHTFKAFLSGTAAGSFPAATFMQSSIPYAFPPPANTQVAASWTALSGVLDHAIDHDEHGVAVGTGSADLLVWTDTQANGQPLSGNCNNWVDGEALVLAAQGLTNTTTGSWANGPDGSCAGQARIYCFEQ